ncbi:MAG: Lpp/OprI family alanine-zipper lipoprotein [Methylococcales bacterium]|nr:Lpp/OprI family alanine-zipper lipoprotein [Methylococcales bacterium]
MKKIVKLSMVALVASLVVGCASQGDLDALSARVDGLATSVAQASSDAASAKSAADQAAATAASAEAAANRAEQAAMDTNSKLDKLFSHGMKK